MHELEGKKERDGLEIKKTYRGMLFGVVHRVKGNKESMSGSSPCLFRNSVKGSFPVCMACRAWSQSNCDNALESDNGGEANKSPVSSKVSRIAVIRSEASCFSS